MEKSCCMSMRIARLSLLSYLPLSSLSFLQPKRQPARGGEDDRSRGTKGNDCQQWGERNGSCGGVERTKTQLG